MHIVIALDGSTESLMAVREVAKLPWPHSPEITIVTALVDTPYDLVSSDEGLRLGEAEKKAAHENFESAKIILSATSAKFHHVVERVPPRRLIIDVAKRLDADLIALGARGHSAAYRVVLGSTADYVANHAKCSVFIARAMDEKRLEHPDAFRILMAYDGSEEAKEAYRQMCDFDWPKAGTAVHLAMILEKPKLIPEDVVYDPAEIQASEATLTSLKRPEQIASSFKQSVRESLHVGNSIRRLAEEEASQLIFIGGTGKSLVARFFLGSTSGYILHHADCSLWIGRKKAWK